MALCLCAASSCRRLTDVRLPARRRANPPNRGGSPECRSQRRGRWSPSFAMRVSRVVALSPSCSAAPPAPRIRHLVLSSTPLMCSFSTSASLTLRRAAAPDLRYRDRQTWTVGADHRALHQVAQLADVARPGVSLQHLHVVFGDRLDALAEGRRELLDEAPHQHRNVLGPLAQRRHPNRKDIQPVIQIFAEGVGVNPFLEIPMRRGDDSRVDLGGLRAAQPLDLPVLQHAQELDLDVERQVTNLVQEDRRSVGELEAADLARQGPRVGAFSRPNSSLSISVAGMAAQLTRTMARPRRRLSS